MPKREPAPELVMIAFTSTEAWMKWLRLNHADSPGVWARLTKKSAGDGYIEYAEVLEAALCYGWIDGLRKAHDAETFLQKFTPRRKRSIWSKKNRDTATKLIKAGRMQPAGHAEVERAKQDGRWDAAYDSIAKITVPPDLRAAFNKNKAAARAFKGLDSRNRYAVLFRIQTARRADTRARRIAQFVAMLARGKTVYPPMRKKTAAGKGESGGGRRAKAPTKKRKVKR